MISAKVVEIAGHLLVSHVDRAAHAAALLTLGALQHGRAFWNGTVGTACLHLVAKDGKNSSGSIAKGII